MWHVATCAPHLVNGDGYEQPNKALHPSAPRRKRDDSMHLCAVPRVSAER
jgi:hypothetical protein